MSITALTNTLPKDAGDGLGTARLFLRRFTKADLPTLQRLNSDADVMRHLGGVMSPKKTAAILNDRILRYYDEHPGMGAWATVRRDNGECIGFHLLNQVQGESLIQIGYRLFPASWGQGYATEMSRALVHYGYASLGLPVLTANAALDNLASQHVLLKLGLRRSGERVFNHPAYAGIGPVAFFERDAASWLAEFSMTTYQ